MVPSKSKFVTYYRVSTLKQGQSGLGLEAQKAAANQYLQAHLGVELASYTEIESGKNFDNRPKLQAALLRCRQTRATLLVAKLDRLSRNVAFLMTLRDTGVKFQALDLPEANSLTLSIFAAMAQFERETTSARTKAALAARKARGHTLGTPRDMSAHQPSASVLGNVTNTAKAQAFAKDIAPQIEAAKECGHTTLRAIAAYLNEQEIPTPRGKQWNATAVNRVLAQI